ncbi:MarR family transcriptional regulator [Schleiferilactobacillus harbinensis]|jgi:DNA-binding MarR family transcriptional regulator|uniref:MarR family transcriptional regulator n=2 Tax=Schleiferilactobacillus harbinensis TaxID=304207 RepID=A0A510TV38_9LACO|nr:MarR family transcriptional regulator [Schleiferilactobacillus harbinensis]HAY52432.1 MarR family transcriptional regulator [Lactobacillus sp.]KRM29752.1 transcriptional regulator [Schleiferilactobacillus harbinensis DSM 16991]MCI1687034.1 MarR family transcriptional regulator [Schleiferilactobacillus harbinensis]MCI1782876.1 MarR family transcriptional regulator [Schleiferilactobacillus harbinensis]MCI1850893.1 MarR family transcriptional regulator [Schleiferilactobacillus harbinensis]
MTAEIDALISQLNITARRVQAYLNVKLKPLNLTVNNYYFILKINHDTPLTQDQLFKRIYLSPSNVTRRLSQLIDLGLVEKQRSAADGRSWTVTLTPEGKALVPKVERILAQVNTDAFGDLPPVQQSEMIDALKLIDHNLA